VTDAPSRGADPAAAAPGAGARSGNQRQAPRSDLPGARSGSGLAPLLLAATLLRFWRLGAQSLSAGEASTWSISSLPVARIPETSAAREGGPPLFHLITAAALRLGDTETHLRLVSVVASIGLVWLTYRLARLVAGRQTALLAAGFTALSPFQIRYAQEARSDALTALLVLGSLYLFARAVMRGRERDWIALAMVTALALWAQTLALAVVAAQAVAMLALRLDRRRWAAWSLATVGALLPSVPWLLNAGRLRVASISDLALVTLTALASVPLAMGLVSIRAGRWSMAAAAALLALSSWASFRYYTGYTRERWREVAESIASASRPGRAAVLVPFAGDAFRYYDRRLVAPPPVFEITQAAPSSRRPARSLEEIEGSARLQIAPFDEVWVVARGAGSAAPHATEAIAHRVAASGRTLMARERWEATQGPLRVSRYRSTEP
jgi:dolichyl-phosphate-mannose-protein mannosyltransferase